MTTYKARAEAIAGAQHIITAALHVAAGLYIDGAEACAVNARLAAHFRGQAAEARILAEVIEAHGLADLAAAHTAGRLEPV